LAVSLYGEVQKEVIQATLADLAQVRTLLPAARAQDLQRQLPGLSSGEGVAETSFGGYRPLAAQAEQSQSSGGR
jgi:hypothetical protein